MKLLVFNHYNVYFSYLPFALYIVVFCDTQMSRKLALAPHLLAELFEDKSVCVPCSSQRYMNKHTHVGVKDEFIKKLCLLGCFILFLF